MKARRWSARAERSTINEPRAVILAAGASSRAGRQKLLMDFRGRPMIEHVIEAARRWRPVVVCSPEIADYLGGRDDVALVVNDEPQRGMSHSLSLANDSVENDISILVLLADKPLVTESLIDGICRQAAGADVVYPARQGETGHPVLLSPRARHHIEMLPPGDTLRRLRVTPSLTNRAVETNDPGAFFDVDTVDRITAE